MDSVDDEDDDVDSEGDFPPARAPAGAVDDLERDGAVDDEGVALSDGGSGADTATAGGVARGTREVGGTAEAESEVDSEGDNDGAEPYAGCTIAADAASAASTLGAANEFVLAGE